MEQQIKAGDKILAKCPFCNKQHEVKIISRNTTLQHKGKEITFEELACVCEETEAMRDFLTGDILMANRERIKEEYAKL